MSDTGSLKKTVLDCEIRNLRNSQFAESGIRHHFSFPELALSVLLPYTFLMRLNGIQARVIRETLADVFGSDMHLILFGSRVDDNARGGDIDLLVEAPLAEDELFRRKITALAKLSTRLGEQKIDLVTTSGSKFDTRAIVQAALEEGVPL